MSRCSAPNRMKFLSLCLLFLCQMAGCLGGVSSCDAVEVPKIRGGSHAVFDADTVFSTPTVFGLASWPEDDPYPGPPAEPPNLAMLRPGDRLAITVAEQAVARPTANGSAVEAIQITTWWQRGADGHLLPIADEWLSAASGQMVYGGARHVAQAQDLNDRTMFYNMGGAPAALWASLFAGAALKVGHGGSLSWNHGFGMPGELPAGVDWRVVGVGGATCTAVVQIDWDRYDAGTITHVVELDASSPFPARLVKIYAGNEVGVMQRISVGLGSGSEVGRWTPHATLPAGWQVQPVKQAWPVGSLPHWPTPLNEAIEAIRAHDAWLDERPDAQLVEVGYRGGEPHGDALDRWTLHWFDGVERRGYAVEQQADPAPIVDNQYDVTSVDGGRGDTGFLPLNSRLPSLEALQEFYTAAGGGALETMDCFLQGGAIECRFGSHEGRQVARAGEFGGGRSWPGFVLDGSTGMIRFENSVDDSLLSTPVPYPE